MHLNCKNTDHVIQEGFMNPLGGVWLVVASVWGRSCRKQINREEGLVLQEVKSAAIVLLTGLCLVFAVASCRLHHQRHKKFHVNMQKALIEVRKKKKKKTDSFVMSVIISSAAVAVFSPRVS